MQQGLPRAELGRCLAGEVRVERTASRLRQRRLGNDLIAVGARFTLEQGHGPLPDVANELVNPIGGTPFVVLSHGDSRPRATVPGIASGGVKAIAPGISRGITPLCTGPSGSVLPLGRTQ